MIFQHFCPNRLICSLIFGLPVLRPVAQKLSIFNIMHVCIILKMKPSSIIQWQEPSGLRSARLSGTSKRRHDMWKHHAISFPHVKYLLRRGYRNRRTSVPLHRWLRRNVPRPCDRNCAMRLHFVSLQIIHLRNSSARLRSFNCILCGCSLKWYQG